MARRGYRATPSRYPDRMTTDAGHETERAERWAATMAGHPAGLTLRSAHADSAALVHSSGAVGRAAREEFEAARLAPGATRAVGAGRRATPEEPDSLRTCFER